MEASEALSKETIIARGVPQEIVLEQLLFMVALLKRSTVTQTFTFASYADDTKAVKAVADPFSVNLRQKYLDAIYR